MSQDPHQDIILVKVAITELERSNLFYVGKLHVKNKALFYKGFRLGHGWKIANCYVVITRGVLDLPKHHVVHHGAMGASILLDPSQLDIYGVYASGNDGHSYFEAMAQSKWRDFPMKNMVIFQSL